MGWSIANLDNTVEISDEIAQQLIENQEHEGQFWYDAEEAAGHGSGKIYFDPDHMEHMDGMMHDEKIIKVLTDAKVEGRITFGDLEGDNFGSFWGWEFDGKGGVTKLKGELSWKVA